VSPVPVDFVYFTFWLDPANRLNFSLVYGVITAFLLDMADKISPAPVNVVIAALLFNMADELNYTVVDFAACHF
jgi:hypothetical protein